jgi:hypothetical protein
MSDLRERFRERAIRAPKFEPVTLPEIGTVFVKQLTAGEKDAWECTWTKTPSGENMVTRAGIVIHACCDEQGVRIFDDDDVGMINEMSPAFVDPILKAFSKINILDDEDRAAIAKNSNGQVAHSS